MRARSRRWLVGVGLAVVGALVAAALLARSADDDGPPLIVFRPDQAGYEPSGTTPVPLMADRELTGEPYRVLDGDGDVVQDGTVEEPTGRWNDTYVAVHIVDAGPLDPGTYRVELGGATSPELVVAPGDELLPPMLDLAVRFFQAQRDGADVVPEVMEREPSHLLDEEATVYEVPQYDGEVLVGDGLEPAGLGPVDVSGGWFDAGDFLKITGTTAFATIALARAERAAPEADGLSAEVDLGLDWLRKMWDAENRVLYSQVGLGQGNEAVLSDHDVWRLPEADDADGGDLVPGDPAHLVSHRPVFPANRPGGPLSPNLAGRVAAAFAMGARRALEADDAGGAAEWLELAADVYQPGVDAASVASPSMIALTTAVPDDFYPETSWADDLELAAAEMVAVAEELGDSRAAAWRAEAEEWAEEYLRTAEDDGGTLGVADVSALAHAALIDLGVELTPELEADLRRQLDRAAAQAARDPFRAGADLTEFDSAPNAFAIVATEGLYRAATGDRSSIDLARQQRAWALGANPWGTSFVIGLGERWPQCPEHQVANLTGGVLEGAVVNGPNARSVLSEPNSFETMVPCRGPDLSAFDSPTSAFVDDVGSWQTVEPAIDFTATAALAFAVALDPS